MIGSTLDGRYRIDAVLGMGGMGCVYRGVHTGLQRPFAIKVLDPQTGRDTAMIESFRREAFASGQLDHPNIIAVSDFGALDDGSMFLAMEVLEGESLRERIERDGLLTWLDAIEIMRGMLAGLGYAHDREIVHCDVKPDNIFLARKHGDVFVKLLDFGIARLLDRASENELAHGTPDYVCPEQAQHETITAASDIYSASIVLYEMLTGSPPFNGIDAQAKLYAHVYEPVPPFDPNLQIPARLEELVRIGLAKDPKVRFASAHDYLRQLDELLLAMGMGAIAPQMSSPFAIVPRAASRPGTERAVTELPPEGRRPITTLLTRTIRSRRIWLVGGGIAVAAAAILYLVWPAPPAVAPVAAPAVIVTAPAPPVVLPDPLLDRAALAIDQGRIASPPGENALALIEQAPASPRATSLRYRAITTLRASAKALWDHGKHDSARTLYADLVRFAPDDAEAKARAVAPVVRVTAVKPTAPAARVSWLISQIDLAIIDRRFTAPANHNALEYLLELRSVDPTNAATLQRSSEVAAALTTEAAARPKDAPSLLTAAKRARGSDEPHPVKTDQAKPWLTKGRAELAAGNYNDANADFQRAVAADSASHGGFAGLAEVAYNRADFTRAAISGKRAVELAPSVLAYRMILAKAYYKLMRFDDAIKQWQAALALDPNNALARQNIQIAKSKRG
jgi:tRNA A-37 threonylcarbamoyl transferase component Bud32